MSALQDHRSLRCSLAEVVEDEEAIPRPLRPEKAAGTVVAKLVADDECVVMRYRPDRDPGQKRA